MYVTLPSWYICSAGSLRCHCTSICQGSEGNIFQRIVAIWCYSALNLLYQARPSREFGFGDVGVSLSRDFCRSHTRGPGRLERWCETSWMNEAPKLQVCLNVNNSPGVRNHIIGWLSLSCESLYQWDDIFYIPVPGPPQELYGQLVFVMVLLLGTTEKHELSWRCQLCRHWWYRWLSLWQPPMPPVTTKLTSWRLLVFGIHIVCFIVDLVDA